MLSFKPNNNHIPENQPSINKSYKLRIPHQQMYFNQPIQNPPIYNQPIQNPIQIQPIQIQPIQNPIQIQPIQNPPIYNQPIQNQQMQSKEDIKFQQLFVNPQAKLQNLITSPVNKQNSMNKFVDSIHSNSSPIFTNVFKDDHNKEHKEINTLLNATIPSNNLKHLEQNIFNGTLNTNMNNNFENNSKIGVRCANSMYKFKDLTSNMSIGIFHINHLIKYVISPYDKNNKFLPNLNATKYENAKEIIKKFVCKIKLDESHKTIDLELCDYIKSPFMGNIEMLISINNDLKNFESTELYDQLKHIDKHLKEYIEYTIRHLIYTFLNYTLKIISSVSPTVNNPELKNKLLNYTIWLVFRISQYAKLQINDVVAENKKIENMLQTSNKLKIILNKKLQKLQTDYQSINKLPIDKLYGGNNDVSTSSSESSNSNSSNSDSSSSESSSSKSSSSESSTSESNDDKKDSSPKKNASSESNKNTKKDEKTDSSPKKLEEQN